MLAGWPVLAAVCQGLAALTGIVFALLTMRLSRCAVAPAGCHLPLLAAGAGRCHFALIMLFTAAIAPGIADDPRWTIALA